ncbi:MAG: hypothetical protein U0168_09745 [Nannocystaceae bacterium]
MTAPEAEVTRLPAAFATMSSFAFTASIAEKRALNISRNALNSTLARPRRAQP